MKLDELTRIALSNLWRTKLRTSLTTLGVIIGIGALVSMVSFGTGLQKNVTDVFHKNDLFTSLFVTPQKIDIEQVMEGNVEAISDAIKPGESVITDAVIDTIMTFSEVEIAFPDISFPVKLRLGAHETTTRLQSLPAKMGTYRPFNKLEHGRFFNEDDAKEIIVSESVLKDLKIVIADDKISLTKSSKDTLQEIQHFPADSILGKEIEVITSTVDIQKMMRNPLLTLSGAAKMPVKESSMILRLAGITGKPTGFESGRMHSNVIAPLKIAKKLPRMGFNSVWDLLGESSSSDGYGSLYVRVKHISDIDTARKKIEDMGFGVYSITDQLEEIKKGFLLFDTALGAIGTIALIVAALGIINTMIMSNLERTREIGVMKAIGGSETEIKCIFFIEAGFIGLLGGILGVILGWIVTRVANVVGNYYLAKEGAGMHVEMFYIPLWLILGAVIFALLVSLLAGLYPANRAARVDPVQALRHD